MNIAKISNTNFKGAYFIKGQGKDVKQAETKIKSVLGDEGKIHKLGFGYTTGSMPAYLLVTTGADVKKYNKFASEKLAQCLDEIIKERPEEKAEGDFETGQEFLRYKINHRGELSIDAIADNCPFSDVDNPDIFDANLVLEGIDADCFDCSRGKFVQ